MNGPAESDPTAAGRSPAVETAKARPRDHYSFLRAPQGPDELGRLGGYRVIRLLGSGGMGFVFEAEELALHRRVALKVLRPDLEEDPANRERFIREARAVAAIASDHVVTIYHIGDGDVPYLAMQFLEGESLQTRIERSPPLTLREALEVARQTAEGLAAAHAVGMTHRDIKPANLWLEPLRTEDKLGSGSAFRVKLLDFGLARRSTGETSLTSTGFIVGTPNYMSPEQAAGAEVDGRADLFSLGCVLYMILAGELPFQGTSAMAVMMALANKTPPPVSEKNPAVPPSVAKLVSRLLEKDPRLRPQSAREVVAALAALLAGLSGSIPLPLSSADRLPAQSVETPGAGTGATLPPTPIPHPDRRLPAARKSRRRSRAIWFILGVAACASLAIGIRAILRDAPQPVPPTEPILVGVLHSQTGTMAVSEMPIIDATVLAIEEVNAAGGVLGRPLKAVVVDGKSDPAAFQVAAERLVRTDRVAVVFGCMTSPSRKAVKTVVERDNGLLFYPVSYEGLEQSPRIVYVGAAPNQKFLPGVEYLVKTLGKKRLFVVGSDLVSPRSATEVVREHLKLIDPDARIVDSRFIPLGSADVAGVVDAIVAAKPDAVVNVLNGSSNFPFYRELRRRGVRPKDIPTLSIALTEHDLVGLDTVAMAGDYLAANYFQSLDREESRAFIRKTQERYGAERVVTDNMVAAYAGVHLWARAAAKAGTPDPEAVAAAVRGVEFEGPGGIIHIDPENQHAWRRWRVGQIRADGTVKVVAEAAQSVRADPFPATRTRREWDRLLNDLFVEWGGRWQAPDKQ